jgi:hypothetical protein
MTGYIMDAKIVRRSEDSYTIEVEIPYGGSMSESEELIQQQINKAGSLATGESLLQFDTDGSPVIVEGKKMTSKGKIAKTYQTPYGDVVIERHVYQGSSGGRGYCPLEKNARIITTATPKFAKTVSSKYADMGGARVRKDLESNHGRKISKSHIQRICDVVGSIASVKEESRNYKIPSFEKEVSTVTIGIDGTCMLTVEDGYRQAMAGTIGLYDDEGTRLHTIYTAAKPEYGKQTFLSRMENEIARVRALCPDAKYVGLADGARDNWPFSEKHTSEQISDFYHASEYIGNVGNAAIRKKSQREEWIRKQCHALKHESEAAEKICIEMSGFLNHRLSEEKRSKIESAVTYFKNNLHRTDYAKYTEENIPIGSGVTEAACKVIVKQRMCCSGMKWKDDGASVVLTLRCLNYSDGRWEQFWNKIDRYGFPLAA